MDLSWTSTKVKFVWNIDSIAILKILCYKGKFKKISYFEPLNEAQMAQSGKK